MSNLIVFNKPFNVLCQFSGEDSGETLKKYICDKRLKNFYPAGRLDKDSEGLVLLTNDGKIQHAISDPKHKWVKTYWVQLENTIDNAAINTLSSGVKLKDGVTRPASAKVIDEPDIWPRVPPIRERKSIPTSWIELSLTEGKNRQVRRMTAAAGFPTLRLIRYSIGSYSLSDLKPGEYKLTTFDPRNSTKR